MRLLDEILTGRYELPDPTDWMAQYREIEPLIPRFDRVAVHAMTDLDAVPRQKPTLRPSVDDPLGALFGIPVVVDEGVERGWLEMRKGDELVERIRIST